MQGWKFLTKALVWGLLSSAVGVSRSKAAALESCAVWGCGPTLLSPAVQREALSWVGSGQQTPRRPRQELYLALGATWSLWQPLGFAIAEAGGDRCDE